MIVESRLQECRAGVGIPGSRTGNSTHSDAIGVKLEMLFAFRLFLQVSVKQEFTAASQKS